MAKSDVKNWLSNMGPFESPLIYQGISFRTVEHFYQAMKAGKAEVETRLRIATLASPYEAKREGKRIRLRADWDEVKLEVMEYALRYKFAPGTTWHVRLMATHDEEIVERNDWGDTYWGVDLRSGHGQNHLGRLLMKLRAEWIGDSKPDAFELTYGKTAREPKTAGE